MTSDHQCPWREKPQGGSTCCPHCGEDSPAPEGPAGANSLGSARGVRVSQGVVTAQGHTARKRKLRLLNKRLPCDQVSELHCAITIPPAVPVLGGWTGNLQPGWPLSRGDPPPGLLLPNSHVSSQGLSSLGLRESCPGHHLEGQLPSKQKVTCFPAGHAPSMAVSARHPRAGRRPGKIAQAWWTGCRLPGQTQMPAPSSRVSGLNRTVCPQRSGAKAVGPGAGSQSCCLCTGPPAMRNCGPCLGQVAVHWGLHPPTPSPPS